MLIFIKHIVFFFSVRNPLEVTEEFVQHYNGAASESEQQKYQTLALKMLARIKVNDTIPFSIQLFPDIFYSF